MAKKQEQPSNQEPDIGHPSDAELFAGPVQNDYSAQDIFAGDDSLYEALAKAQSEFDAKPQTKKAPKRRRLRLKQNKDVTSRFSLLQKSLAAAIFLVAFVLAYAVFKTPKNTLADANASAPMDMNTSLPEGVVAANTPPTTPSVTTAKAQTQEDVNNVAAQNTQTTLPSDMPLSLRIAQDMFDSEHYSEAFQVYNQLQQYLQPTPDNTAFYDFLTLHKGLCQAMNQESIQARRSLALAAKSETPSIRTMANYHLSRLELSQNQFMNARAKACEALGLIDALTELPKEWVAELKQTCCYIAAESTSKQALVLCDADKALPASLTPAFPVIANPWYNLNETQVRHLLSQESGMLPNMLLKPEFTLNDTTPQNPWTVSCHRMAIDELLARFGANTNMEVTWHDEANYLEFRKRAITVHIAKVSDQTVISLAAGSAGLLAQIGEDNMIHVMNPVSTTRVSDQVAMLAQEATTMWQRYLFSSKESPNFANAHFTSGILNKQLGLQAEAISEFKLVASRYSRSQLAPYALFYSSQVKEELQDTVGVQEDLKLLVEQYPDVSIVTEAYMRLAQTVAKLGDYDNAATLYRKVYYLNLSEESRANSALSAGKSFYEIGDFESAELWLTQFITLKQNDARNKDIHQAYYLLGKSLMALNKPRTACQAFRNALKGELAKTDYMETLASLVQGYMQQQDLMEAIDILENTSNAKLAPADLLQINLLKSEALRHAGLIDRAVELLQNSKGSVADTYLNAQLSYELSLCLIEQDDLPRAQKELTQIMLKVESGELAQKAAITLAQVCLDLKQSDQAVTVCQSILDLEPDKALTDKAVELMAKAYLNQQNYDKAAQTLIGQWN